VTVTSVRKDPEARTMTITAAFAASTERVWQLWEDPRLLERWWGPPTYPATVVDHDLSPGGRVTYYMTGPEGDQPADGGVSSRPSLAAISSSRTGSQTAEATLTRRCRR